MKLYLLSFVLLVFTVASLTGLVWLLGTFPQIMHYLLGGLVLLLGYITCYKVVKELTKK